jgi:hypothetical protein
MMLSLKTGGNGSTVGRLLIPINMYNIEVIIPLI